MTIAALTNALTGLQASQRALAVVSNNIANANTEGYTKKIAQFESLNFGHSSGGVQIGDIARNVDEYLMRDRREALGDLRQIEAQDDYLQTVENLFGTLADSESVSALVNEFGTALEQLATFPEDVFNHKLVVDTAEDLIEKLGFINERLQDLRVQADQEIAEAVTEINDILEQIDEYNVQIARAQAVDPEGGIDEDLRDKRDVQLNRLSELIDISYYEDSNGTVSVSTVSGTTLLNVDPLEVSHDAAVTLDQGIRYDPDELVTTSADGVIAGIFVGTTKTAATDITNDILRGRIKGLIEVRDTVLPNLQEQLDSLAETMQTEVNRVHNLNSAFPPATELNGTRIFSSYDAATDDFDQTLASNALLSATGVVRFTVVRHSPSSGAGDTVETLSIDLDELRSRDYSGVTDLVNGLAGSAAGELSIGDLAIAINNAMGQDSGDFGAILSVDSNGRVTLEAAEPSKHGVVVHTGTNMHRSQGYEASTFASGATAGATINDFLSEAVTLTVDPAEFYVVDAASGNSLNGNTAISLTAGATYEDLLVALNGIDGVTASVVHDPGADGESVISNAGTASTDDRFYIEITADDGSELRFVDTSGSLMTGSANGELSLSQNDESVAFSQDPGATNVDTVFGSAAGASQIDIYDPDDGSLIGSVTLDPSATTVSNFANQLNAVNGVRASVEEVFTDPATATPYYVVRVQATDGSRLTLLDNAGDMATTTGLTEARSSETTAASVTSAESKSFPSGNVTLDRFDGEITSGSNISMTITYPNGQTQTITVDPGSDTLDDVATAINALGAVGTAGTDSVTLGARVINENGRRLEVYVQQADQDSLFSGSIGFSGDLADTLGMEDSESTNFSHYLGLNDFFVDDNEDSLSQTLDVRSDIKGDEGLLARATVRNSIGSFTDTTGTTNTNTAIAAGNNQGALDLAEVFQTNFSFSAVGTGSERFNLSALNGTLSEYASRIVSNTGLEIRIVQDELEFRDTVVEELEFRLEGIQGVNLDEEMSDMILFQNAFTAAARVVTASQEILDELVNIVR